MALDLVVQSEAQKFNLTNPAQNLIISTGHLNPILDFMPFYATNSGANEVFNREDVQKGVAFDAIGAQISAGASTDATYSQVTVALRKLISKVGVDSFTTSTANSLALPTDPQIRSGLQNMFETWSNTFINGVSTGNAFAGLNALLASTPFADQSFGSQNSDTVLTLDHVDELLDSITAPTNAIMGLAHPQLLRQLRKLIRDNYNVDPFQQGAIEGMSGRSHRALMYHDIPFFPCTDIGIADGEDTNETALYIVGLDAGDKQSGCAGLYAESHNAQPLSMGLRGIGMTPAMNENDYDAEYWLLKQYTAFTCYNTRAIARRIGILS